MFISVFVPTGKRVESLKKVLVSLNNQTYKNFEIIVVDYKSSNELFDLIQSYKDLLDIKVVHQTEKGLSKAANLALEVARGEIFIRTDDDVVMDKMWLASVHETFIKDEKIGGVTGPTIVPNDYITSRDLFVFEKKLRGSKIFWKILGKIYFDFFMEGTPRRVSHWFKSGAFSLGSNYEESLKEPFQEVTNLEACNLCVRTELLRKVRGFDSIYTGVGEYHEADAALKIKQLGYKLVFNPSVIVNHCPSQDGFFNERPNSYSRMINFIVFHSRFLKTNSFDAFFRYMFYLVFLNTFYIYSAIIHRQAIQIMAIPGTIVGLARVTFDRKLTKHA
jgi:GT2 family glycosyltransferase